MVAPMATILLRQYFPGGTYWTPDSKVGICDYAARRIFDDLPALFTLEYVKGNQTLPGWCNVRLVSKADGVVAYWTHPTHGECNSILTTHQEETLVKMGIMEKGEDVTLMLKALDK